MKMKEDCNHNCDECLENCEECEVRSDNGDEKTGFAAKLNEMSKVKKVFGVMSGKGGVGKSLVTCFLAAALKRQGVNVGILDADVTGPSIPRMMGIKGIAEQSDFGLLPGRSRSGIKVMSANLLLGDENDPIVWRGPLVGNLVKQFWTDVVWDEVDVLLVDMPPGTGDVALTVFQSLPVDGVILVTTPQDLVSMIVTKAVKMAEKMSVPVLGIVENMSFFKCPDCGKEYSLFGESRLDEKARKWGVEHFVRLPLDPQLSLLCDRGTVEFADVDPIRPLAEYLHHLEVCHENCHS